MLRALGAGLAVFGGILGLRKLGRRRKPSAADIMRMDDRTFGRHIQSTGLEAQVRAALSRIDRGPA